MSQPFIDTFIAQIRDKGFVKSNRFVAFIRPNNHVTSRYLGYEGGQSISAVTQRLAMTCYSASIQSPSFFTHEFGVTLPNRLVPYALNTNNGSGASFEFYCLGDMFEKEVFHKWMRNIVDPYTREVDYYNDYAKNTEIDLLIVPNYVETLDELIEFVSIGSAGGRTPFSGFTFTEVYPYNYTYSDGSLNWSPSTSPATVKVDFMFREIIPFGSYPKARIDIGDTQQSLSWDQSNAFTIEKANQRIKEQEKSLNEIGKRQLKNQKEKERIAREYNQSRNLTRGVDGKLLNPKVDGLPPEKYGSTLDDILRRGLSFVEQARGFGIIRL